MQQPGQLYILFQYMFECVIKPLSTNSLGFPLQEIHFSPCLVFQSRPISSSKKLSQIVSYARLGDIFGSPQNIATKQWWSPHC